MSDVAAQIAMVNHGVTAAAPPSRAHGTCAYGSMSDDTGHADLGDALTALPLETDVCTVDPACTRDLVDVDDVDGPVPDMPVPSGCAGSPMPDENTVESSRGEGEWSTPGFNAPCIFTTCGSLLTIRLRRF